MTLTIPLTRTPLEKVSATRVWACTAATRCASTAASTRSPVRRSTAYARIVEAPTTDSDTADRTPPTRSRTRPYAVDTARCIGRASAKTGRKQAHTTAVSRGE